MCHPTNLPVVPALRWTPPSRCLVVSFPEIILFRRSHWSLFPLQFLLAPRDCSAGAGSLWSWSRQSLPLNQGLCFNGGCNNIAHAILAHHQAEAENWLIRSVSDWQSCDVTSWTRSTFSSVAESFLSAAIWYFKNICNGFTSSWIYLLQQTLDLLPLSCIKYLLYTSYRLAFKPDDTYSLWHTTL